MEIAPTYLVLADVSGYTRFIREHKRALSHAEAIITDLMEAVIDGTRHPLQLNKLEGDAALFFVQAEKSPQAARDVLGQAVALFAPFRRKQAELIACDCCGCAACRGLVQLKLKAFLHHGAVAVKRVKQFQELAGEDVILAHRLMKNTVPSHEYVLMTEAFYDPALEGEVGPVDWRSEHYDDFGDVRVAVHYPRGQPAPASPPPTPRQMIGQNLRYRWHHLLRSMGLRRPLPLRAA
ncbi:MAG: DUF2652 domain-containing protein [Candidatus Lambdaproteobacteria bacterium]|nr:DUF2652 domain-containing protein [Candidatus Lambdaproteobacteria bacterium]